MSDSGLPAPAMEKPVMGTERDHIATAGKMVVPDHIASAGKLIAAPVEAGLVEAGESLVERLLQPFPDYAPDTRDYRSAIIIYQDERKQAAALIEAQSAEIARTSRLLSEERALVGLFRAAFEEGLDEIDAAHARIATLETADRENSELLEAAIEGQSHWQARAERLAVALEALADSVTLRSLRGSSHVSSMRLQQKALSVARSALADPQPTQGGGKIVRVKVTQEQRNTYARAVEGDSDNPLRVAKANEIYDGHHDGEVAKFIAANPRPQKPEEMRDVE